MRVKTGKAVSKYLGALIVLLLFLLREAFPNAAFAFTSLNACARSKECLELIKGSSRSAVSAPTSAGSTSTAISSTTSSGVVKTFINAPADFAIVVGPSAAYLGWHYWSQAQNERVQAKAREKYCAVNSGDSNCVAPQILTHLRYVKYGSFNPSTSPRVGGYDFQVLREYKENIHWGIFKITGCHGTTYYVEFSQLSIISSGNVGDVCPDSAGNWRNWSQAKRDAAVALLTDSEWQSSITSMPRGGALDAGDNVKAPKIPIPGQEWDNPNTPWDDRRLKTVPGELARPVVPDFDHDSDPDETDADDDNDGFIEPYDPEPRNPYVPRASSEPPSPPEDDRTNQSEGERAVSEERERYGKFLEKPENDAFENRLDAIEDKYRRAAAEQNEIERDWLNMEADDELQQLKNELGEAWWTSLSQYEQQLFNGRSQADIDEMLDKMDQWDKATYDDVAHSILDHSSRKGYEDPLDYLRAASNFSTSGATREPLAPGEYYSDGTATWTNRRTGEFITVDRNGMIRTYGVNLP